MAKEEQKPKDPNDSISKLDEEVNRVRTSLEKKAHELAGQLEEAAATFHSKQADLQTKLEERAKATEETLTELESIKNKVAESVESIQKTVGAASENHEHISKLRIDSANAKAEIERQLQEAKGSRDQCQQHTKDSGQHSAETKAKLESATQSLANIEEQKKNIVQFYVEIEEHKARMTETEKKAGAKFNVLAEKTEANVAQFEEKTEQIIAENENLQHQIQEHLARAVSISLFRAFGDRQKRLYWSKWLWLFLLAGALASAIALVQYIVKNVGTGTDMAFFIRLTLAGPLAFLIYFAASQYRKDRQAEEEYAFKSAISISLEPYRDLLKKMREENATETEFVQELMQEVFDNPVKYLYRRSRRHAEAGTLQASLLDAFGTLKDLTEDLTEEQSGALMKFITTLSAKKD